MKRSIPFLVFLIAATTAIAQDSVYQFTSTRLAFHEGYLLVPKGKAQVELGGTYSNFRQYHDIQHPSFILKYGISEYFELRVNGDATTYKFSDSIASGLRPVYIGMKIKMMDAKRYAPGSSFIGGLSANIISTKNFRTKYVAPYFRICMEQFLPKNVGLAYNYGLFWNGEDAKPTYTFAVATSYTQLLKKSGAKHKQVKLFLEVIGLYPHGQQFDARVNTGFAFLLNKWLQFDLSAGAGFLKASPRFTTSMGLSMRFPTKDKKKKAGAE
jgi:hypothetical protein